MALDTIFISLKEIVKIWKTSFFYLFDKKFWLITLKASMETYWVLFMRFWWLIGLFIFFEIVIRNENLITYYFISSPSGALRNQIVGIQGICYFIVFTMLLFTIFLIVRPSLVQKNKDYFLQYWSRYIWFMLVTLFFIIIEKISFVHREWSMFWYLVGYIETHLLFFQNLTSIVLYMSPFLCLYTFFYLDSKKTVSEFFYCAIRTVKLVLATYPFLVIVWYGFSVIVLLIYLINQVMYEKLFYAVPSITEDCIVLFLPLYFCLLNNLYTKQVHDHYDLYT